MPTTSRQGRKRAALRPPLIEEVTAVSALVRGRPTAPTVIPRHWRGPLPDVSIQRRLDVHDGYAEVPESLLHGGFQDLGILVWAQLRLWFDDREGKTSYQELAEALAVDSGSASAVKAKFSAALQPLLGTWIERRRVTENQYIYRAVTPSPRERYAMLRRRDLALLPATRSSRTPVKPADIADFGRWQLECGRRGWTADTTKAIADRWSVTPPTIRASRKRLAALGLLKVVARENRLSELTWLEELYDPHWAVPSRQPTEPRSGVEDGKKSLTSGEGGWEKKSDLARKNPLTSVGKFPLPPIEELTEPLTDDLSDLGGTSVPTVTSATRELRDAPPAASRGKISARTGGPSSASRLAGQILGAHPSLISAPQKYRAAMLRWLREALERGLEPEHVARAVQRVVEEGEIDLHCEVLRRALQQAWADHHAGMCAVCNEGPGRHAPRCPSGPEETISPATVVSAPLESYGFARRTPRPAPSDPLRMLVDQPAVDPAQIMDDAGAVSWICRELAAQVSAEADQHAALQRLWQAWRRRLPGRSDLVDQAAQHVLCALDQRQVS